MRVLGIDFETTGTSPTADRVIEIGAVLWDTDRKQPLHMVNQLIKHAANENVVVSQFIQDLTQIRPADIQDCGVPPLRAFQALVELLPLCEYVVAHNGNDFDKPFFEAEVSRLGLSEGVAQKQRPWIDTRTDVPYPRKMIARNQDYLCREHGVTNYFAHRALFDALAMLQVLSQYDIQEIVVRSRLPMIVVTAKVTYEDREKAKARFFHWEPQTKRWLKSIKECDLADERAESGFEVEPVT